MEAVQLIADGKAPRIDQPEDGATYEGIQKKENAKVINEAVQIYKFISLVNKY